MTWYKTILNIIDTGIDDTVSSFDKRGLQIIHSMVLLGLVGGVASTLYLFVVSEVTFIRFSIFLINISFYVSLFALSKYKKFKATKYMFIAFINISFFFNSLIVDPQLQIEALFICTFALYVALFRKYLHILLFSLGTILLVIGVAYLQTYRGFIAFESFTKEEALPLRIIIFFMAAGIFISITLFFRGGLESKQEELEFSNDELSRAFNKNELQKDNLEKSLKVNRAITKEVHHRVKNNLQLISSLIDLQNNSLDKDIINKEMMDIKTRVHSIALIHQKLYQTEQIDLVDMENYLSDLCYQNISIIADKKNVDFENRMESVSMDIDTAVPVGLMVNEMITNSLKHAFEGIENPVISILLKSEKNNIYRLCVADNGVGYDENCKKGFGSQLLELLAKQIKGEIKMESNNSGLITTLTFKHHG